MITLATMYVLAGSFSGTLTGSSTGSVAGSGAPTGSGSTSIIRNGVPILLMGYLLSNTGTPYLARSEWSSFGAHIRRIVARSARYPYSCSMTRPLKETSATIRLLALGARGKTEA